MKAARNRPKPMQPPAEAAAPDPVIRFGVLARNWHLAPPILLFLLLAGWFITNGNGLLFVHEPDPRLESVYDGLARQLAKGQFDVPPEAIQGEGYVVKGRIYAYFPPTPALPRILLNAIWPAMYGNWSKLLCLLLGLATVLGTVALFRAVKALVGLRDRIEGRDRLLEIVLVVACGLGSTTFFLLSKAIVYHEAPLWAVGLGIWALVCLVWFWQASSTRLLIAAEVLAFFAFFARGSSTLGLLMLLAATVILLAVKANASRLGSWADMLSNGAPVERWKFQAATAASALALVAGLYLWYNWVRWGDPFNVQPFQYYMQDIGRILQQPGNKMLAWELAPKNLRGYWLSLALAPTKGFPWIRFATDPIGFLYSRPFHYVERHAGIAATSTPLFILFLCGGAWSFWRGRRDLRPALAGGCLLAGSVPVLAYFAISERYLHDVYLPLIFWACVGLAVLRTCPSRIFGGMLAVLAALACGSAYIMFALDWTFQRDHMFGVPEARRSQLTEISRGIDQATLALIEPEGAAAVDASCDPSPEPAGQKLKVYDCETRSTQLLAKPFHAEIEFSVPRGTLGSREPLITLGTANNAERIFIAYESQSDIRLGHDHWGTPAVVSDRIAAREGQRLRVSVDLDTVHHLAQISANGIPVLTERRRLHDWGEAPPLFGINPLNAGIRGRFSGSIIIKNL